MQITKYKKFRILALKVNGMNRSKSFDHFEDAKAYIDMCFDKGCNLVHMIRPDDTSVLFMTAEMRIVGQPRMGTYSVYEMAAVSNKSQIDRITAHGMEAGADSIGTDQMSYTDLALANA